MQRRAATVYAVLFLVIAAGSYSLIGVAQEPGIDVQGDSYAENETLTVNGMEYTVASVGDGEGTLSRVNESARYTATLANNSTIQRDGDTYRVLIPNESDPGQFTLQQEFNLSENLTTVMQNETEYVVVDEEGNKSLVPVDEYKLQQFGEPATEQYAEGDTYQYEGNETTVSNVTVSEATLAWNAPRTLQTSVADGSNVTLGPEDDNQTFVAHFPEGQDGIVLSTQTAEYQSQVNDIDDFNERMAGLWGIVILSGLTVALLLGLAFLPNK
ncbi:hypothetical protein [Halorussus lipolyticus]|uniref:hypothetical protein n=1 Tax=Halorussus lipolyticus TaxID=3034024 RepID=UPI0023E7C840|nr:hypothetical protein [Halorussus sp. DT80]